MVHSERESIKYQFTKYVQVALERKRKAYLHKEYKRAMEEEPLELEELLNLSPILMEDSLRIWNRELEYQMPWNAETIRTYLAEQTGEEWEKWFSVLTDRELLILYAKVFREFDFAEIGAIMGIDEKRAASSYAYARKKMRKEQKKNGL